jgi:hypothetical protein
MKRVREGLPPVPPLCQLAPSAPHRRDRLYFGAVVDPKGGRAAAKKHYQTKRRM